MKQCLNCPYPENLDCIGERVGKYNVSRCQLKEQIKEILTELYDKDGYLIQVNANEVCITSRFCYYFLNKFQKDYSDLDIDIEYNRNGVHPKYYFKKDEKGYYAKPDMIIHKRGCNAHNFAYLEFKGYWNDNLKDIENDENKLKLFTSSGKYVEYQGILYGYEYTYGLSIKLELDKADVKWFEKGKHEKKYDFIWSKNSIIGYLRED